jgi:hypothetical protein
LFQSGFRDEGVARFTSALASYPERTEIRLCLAEAHWAMAKSSVARELCRQIVQTKPRVVKANALLACIAAESGNLPHGTQLLVDVHVQDPEGHIAGDIILQSPLAHLAVVDVDISIDLEDGAGYGPSSAVQHDTTTWIRWMRAALWTALRLIKPAVDEVAASRAAWARIAPYLGDDHTPQPTSPAPGPIPDSHRPPASSTQPGTGYDANAQQAPTEADRPPMPRRELDDFGDRTEIINPKHRRTGGKT